MPNIKILEKSVAELIAAGEVVERPASVVKELVENSIDAGATDISVEISGGGVKMIRISDNGCGISRGDIPKAFLRHATSKVRTAEDLDAILTLGFRGEALASVAAMGRVELITKTADETEGTSYVIEGGEGGAYVPAGHPDGTTITVRDLFFNTPARMKFLKKDVSEGNSVAQIVDKCALSHPEIAFRFVRDGALKLKTSGNGDLLSVIYDIYGRELAEELIPVDYTFEHFARVTGYTSKPSGTKPSRSYQTFFINRRFVKTRTGQAALEEAYKNKIMGGKFPACVLNLELDAGTVDVNVHPAKTEVRFVNEKPVFSSVYYAVKTALSMLETLLRAPGQTVIPSQRADDEALRRRLTGAPSSARPAVEQGGSGEKNTGSMEPQRLTAREFRERFIPEEEWTEKSVFAYTNRTESTFTKPAKMNAPSLDICVDDPPVVDANQPKLAGSAKIRPPFHDKILNSIAVNEQESATNDLKPLWENADALVRPAQTRVIGEAFGAYILIEAQNGLLLVDKHAAHERILYEKLKSELRHGNRQVLLSPQSVALTRDEYTAVMENMEQLEKLGFLVEDFGGSSVAVREIPLALDQSDIVFILREIADKLKNNAKDLTPNTLDRLYYSIACRGAIKAGDKNAQEELAAVVKQMEENPSITHCPHGRPVSVRLSRREIEKMFGRLG